MVKYKVCMQKNEKYFYNRVLLLDLRFCKLYAEIFYGFGTTHKIEDYLITQSEQSTICNVLVRYNSTLSQSICLFERISILEIFLDTHFELYITRIEPLAMKIWNVLTIQFHNQFERKI